eukprot:4390880-Alexandrium_andersonii.AAC.1
MEPSSEGITQDMISHKARTTFATNRGEVNTDVTNKKAHWPASVNSCATIDSTNTPTCNQKA